MKSAGRLLLVVALADLTGCSTLPRQPAPVVHRATPVPIPDPQPAPPETKVVETLPPKPAPPPVEKPEKPATPAIDLEQERKGLMDVDRKFALRCQEKGMATAFFEFMAPEGTILQAGELPVRGREAIRVKLSAGPKGRLTWAPVAAEVAASADLGYTWGNYEFRSEGSEARTGATRGKYVSIWKKQADGTWKVALDAASPGPAAALYP